MVNLFDRNSTTVASVLGKVYSFEQTIEICPAALLHMYAYRQTTAQASEAGGQLFGTITPTLIKVSKVSGLYTGDDRSRYRYRSNQLAAQESILRQSRLGLLYLGEWHTHAEDKPDASKMDNLAMELLLKKSELNSNALLMLIIGREDSINGLGLWTFALDHFYRWNLE